jgi:putative Mg2+ transporter-C (MgtC) family protein
MILLGTALFQGAGDLEHIGLVVTRLGAAVILGGLVGFERWEEGKSAGLRTHMLVSLGAALFVLVPYEARVAPEQITRVIQGLTTGIGFLGAGTILQLTAEHRVRGLTTAASIWATAAVGTAVGLGWIWPAAVTVILVLLILYFVGQLELRWEKRRRL